MRVGASVYGSEASCFAWLAGSYQPPPAPKFTSIGVSSAWIPLQTIRVAEQLRQPKGHTELEIVFG
jgi:hypothetical protein